jgi:hypothetical protein
MMDLSEFLQYVNKKKTKYMSLGTDTNYLEVENGDIITGCTE